MHALSISNCCQSSAHTYLFWPKNGHDCKAFFLNKSAAVSGRCIIILKRWKEVKVRKEKNQFETQTTSSLNTQKDECTAAILNLLLYTLFSYIYIILNYLLRQKREIIFEHIVSPLAKQLHLRSATVDLMVNFKVV